jgi:hypothetical protein
MGVIILNKIDSNVILALLISDLILVIIAMVSGPLNHTAISIGASVSAMIVSTSIVAYGLYTWIKKYAEYHLILAKIKYLP